MLRKICICLLSRQIFDAKKNMETFECILYSSIYKVVYNKVEKLLFSPKKHIKNYIKNYMKKDIFLIHLYLNMNKYYSEFEALIN